MATRQTQTANNTITIISVIVAIIAVAFAIGMYRSQVRTNYAINNNCEWRYNYTMYGDDRDYTCVERGL